MSTPEYEAWKKDPISQRALAHIEKLKAALVALQGEVESCVSHLHAEEKRLRDASLEAERVINPKRQVAEEAAG